MEDAAAESKRKSTIGKAVSAVKHATVEPVTHLGKDIKHSETARTVSTACLCHVSNRLCAPDEDKDPLGQACTSVLHAV